MAEYYGEEERVHVLSNRANTFTVVINDTTLPSVGDVLKITSVDGTVCYASFSADDVT